MADMPVLDAPPVEQRLQAVERAVLALRQGMPSIITADPEAGQPALVLVAAETVSELGIAVFRGLAAGTPIVVLAGCRAERVLGHTAGEIAALRLVDGVFEQRALQALADPTGKQDYPPVQPTATPLGAEAAIALAKLAGLLPAILLASASAAPWGAIGNAISSVRPDDIIDHPALSANALHRVSEAVVPLAGMADSRVITFRARGSGQDHLAIVLGRPEAAASPLIRVHSECLTGDLLGSLRCDCGSQLHGAMQRIAAEGAGAVLYLAQEGRGIGLANKLRAYTLQDRGLDTLDANRALGFAGDERDFQIAAAMMRQLGLTRIRLLTNNPAKLASLGQHGIEVTARVSLLFAGNGVNDGYLATKASRFGHMLEQPGDV